MRANYYDYELNESDEPSFGVFGPERDNLDQKSENMMSPFPYYGSLDEFNDWKKEQNQNNEFLSTKKETPLDKNPLWSKEEEEGNLELPLNFEPNTNSYLDHYLEIPAENENQQEEIQSKAPVAVDNKQPIQNPQNLFVSKKTTLRIDYLVKKIKVRASEKMTKEANSRMVPLKSKFYKLSKPSSKEFTSVTKAEKNRAWLKFEIKEIFTIGKESENGSLQKNNWKVIERIEDLEDEKSANIKELLDMTFEDFLIQIFFDSDEFKKFCEDEEIKRLDEEFKRQKGYSIREKYAFIKFIKNY